MGKTTLSASIITAMVFMMAGTPAAFAFNQTVNEVLSSLSNAAAGILQASTNDVEVLQTGSDTAAQDAVVNPTASADLTGGGTVDAANTIDVDQIAVPDTQTNQLGEFDADAITDADLDLASVGLNTILIQQDGTDVLNQSGTANSNADANVTTDLDASALNALGLLQVAPDGQNNQASDFNANADTTSAQAVSGLAPVVSR